MLKRVLSVVLALVLCLSLTACGGGEKKDTGKKPDQSTPDTGKDDQTPDIGDIVIGGEEGDIDLDNITTDTPDKGTEDETTTQKPDNGSQGGTTTPQPNNQTTAIGSPAENVVAAPSETPADFFDNAAFIGDSVTLKLRNYDTANDCLYGATFLCQGSYSVAHAVNNTMYLKYQGQDVTPQDALKACGADKVFILLGMNDIALWGIDKTMENWGKLIANIRSTCPDIKIYIQSGTPIFLGGERGSLNNKNMDAYNVRLLAFAKENGCYYLDVNTPFRNSKGGLAPVYCSDSYVHFTDAACKLWLDILMKLTVQ